MTDDLKILGEHIRRVDRESEADADRARVLMDPLSEDAKTRIAARLSGLRANDAPVQDNVARGPAAWFRRGAPMVGVALAAAVAVLVLRPGPQAIPDYTAIATGDREVRGPAGAHGALRVLGDDSFVELVVRPASAVSTPIDARAFVRRAGAFLRWPARIEVSSGGAVKLSGSAGSLAGADEARVIVGRPDAIGDEASAIDKIRAGGAGRGWQVVVVPIER
jgi:hypothetical protein